MKIDCNDEFNLKKIMPNSNDLKSLTSLFYAFSDDTRLKIIILLTVRPLCVGDISVVLDINQTTISHQLKILKAINIVDCNRYGKNNIYYIKNSYIEEILNVGVECI